MEASSYQDWRTCLDEKVDLANSIQAKYLKLETMTIKRAQWAGETLVFKKFELIRIFLIQVR